MDAQIDEIGDGIFRFSLYVPEIAPPVGFTFNHFLIKDVKGPAAVSLRQAQNVCIAGAGRRQGVAAR